MRIFITGIAGFLGSHLEEELTKLGHEVFGNDNYICATRKPNNSANQSITDCRDFDKMFGLLNALKPDVLIHCAATAHEGLSNFSPSFITKNIYEASVSTFSAAIASGVRRIIFMSSMARYGVGFDVLKGPQSPPFKESMLPVPVDPYGIAKVAAETTLASLCYLHEVEYVIAVPHNIIGPRQRYCDPYRNVASIMINRALQGKSILVYGDGKQKRCFSPIKDCLQSLVKMIDAPISGERINIGPDNGEITVLSLAEMIRELVAVHTGKVVNIEHMPDRPNEVKEAFCSSDKARKLLGYKPQQPINQCLAEMVLHIKTEGTKQFEYTFPLEIITDKIPKTWLNKLI